MTGALPDRLGEIAERVAALVAARRADDSTAADPLRGLYISAELLDTVLRRAETRSPAAPERLDQVAAAFGLDELDVSLLLVALAPDLQPGFEMLYGYLNDDVTRRRASIGLALTLCGRRPADAAARARLAAGAPLLAGGLLVIADHDQPILRRSLRVPDRVIDHLLGGDRTEQSLQHLVRTSQPTLAAVPGLAESLSRGGRLCYLRQESAGNARGRAAAALRQAGLAVVELDLRRLTPADDPAVVAATVDREARLLGAGVLAGPLDAVVEHAAAFTSGHAPTVLFGATYWDPVWSPVMPLTLEAAELAAGERRELWRTRLGDVETSLDPELETAALRLGAEQIEQVASVSRLHAQAGSGVVTGDALRLGLRSAATAGLRRLARRIEPAVGWDHLVLPEPTLRALHGLTARARHRERVLGDWVMRRGGGRGHGVTALFTGTSGTGKTTAAEVVAGELGVDLYTVDLATVVDKYIGETEKNLDRIFTEAAGANAVLLFDEADAIFGKRSAVSDARDRYANIESAYLLQRMEYFDGLAILATNLRSNLDEAFTRRLDMVIEFPRPEQAMRRQLWDVCLGTALPRSVDLDLDECASAYELAGGDIQSASITAAYGAAASGIPVRMTDIAAAVEHEYRKLGRLRPVAIGAGNAADHDRSRPDSQPMQ